MKIFLKRICVLRICSSLRLNSTTLWIYVTPDGIQCSCIVIHPSKHETSTQCCFDVGPPSSTPVHHQSSIGSMSRVCWDAVWIYLVRGLDIMSNKTRCGSLLQTPQDNLLLLSLAGGQKQGPPKHLFKITSLTANIHVWVSGGFIWCSPTLYCPYTVIDEISTNI